MVYAPFERLREPRHLPPSARVADHRRVRTGTLNIDRKDEQGNSDLSLATQLAKALPELPDRIYINNEAANGQWAWIDAPTDIASLANGYAEKVQAAYKAIEQGLSSRDPEAWATYQRAMQSMDPYGQIVQWHQQREVYSQIGNDPNAWFERELEKRMSEDPQFAAKQLQRIQQTTQQSSAAKQAPNRVALPPSLSRMSSAQVATDDGDLTDASLFANAMR